MTSVLAASFTPLLLLACPVGMGLMMWFMSRGMMGGKRPEDRAPAPSVEELRAEQARISAELERRDPHASPAPADRVPSARS